MRLLIGLGGNCGDVLESFAAAVAGLAREGNLIARSGVWRSAPLGPPQPDFLNAVVLVETTAHPEALLALCQRLEGEAGRDRSRAPRDGPRPLDLDLLIAPRLVIESPALTLPHPRFAERRFALAPAEEVAGAWLHPRLHRTVKALATSSEVAKQRCDRVAPPDGWGAAAR